MKDAPVIAVSLRVDHWRARDERRDALDQAWVQLLVGLGYRPLLVPNSLVGPGGKPDALDAMLRAFGVRGVILTGGNDLPGLPGSKQPGSKQPGSKLAGSDQGAPERDATERALLCSAMRHGWPLLGVCRGMQFLVQELGGELVEVPYHVATLHPIEAVGDQPWLGPTARVVNSFHRYGVAQTALPADLEAAAVSPEGWVEAVRHRTLPVRGILWHPERAPHDVADTELLASLFAEVPA